MPNAAALTRRLAIAVTVPVLLMLILALLLAALIVRLSMGAREVAHLERTIADANRLEKLIVDAETGFRAFLLVAGDDFLEPTQSADQQLPGRFAALREATASDPEQLATLDRVAATLREWRGLIDQEIRAKRAGGDYLTMVASRQPKRRVDAMRADIGRFIARQQALRDASQARADRFTTLIVSGVAGGGVLLAVVMWLVTWREVARATNEYGAALAAAAERGEQLRAAAETLEQKVAERTHLLQQANEELEALSYSVSHDLRAPIRHVSGFAELLLQETSASSDEKVRHYVSRILRRTDEAGELIDRLLLFSRTGRLHMTIEEVDTDKMVREIIDAIPASSTRAIHWTVGALPHVRADIGMLRQVFANLIDNAVKYSALRAVAEIQISSSRGPQETTFTVTDNGAGFDSRYADKLFHVFQRLHAPDEFEGTGIGLAIVQRIVLRHGGRVTASGDPDRGARFSFTLPDHPPPGIPFAGTVA